MLTFILLYLLKNTVYVIFKHQSNAQGITNKLNVFKFIRLSDIFPPIDKLRALKC